MENKGSILRWQYVISQSPKPKQTDVNISVPIRKLTMAIWNKILNYRDAAQGLPVMTDDEGPFSKYFTVTVKILVILITNIAWWL